MNIKVTIESKDINIELTETLTPKELFVFHMTEQKVKDIKKVIQEFIAPKTVK